MIRGRINYNVPVFCLYLAVNLLLITNIAQCEESDPNLYNADAGDIEEEAFPLSDDNDLRGNVTISSDDDFYELIELNDDNHDNQTLHDHEKSTEPDIESYAHRSNKRRGSHGSTSKGGHHHSRGRSRMSRVNMPTGKSYYISRPDISRWKCKKPTKLVNLNPKGRTGRREYKIVEREVKKTKREHVDKFKGYNIVKIEKVLNGCFWNRYRKRQNVIKNDAGFVNERMLFHGTNKVKELLESGFDERYASIQGMFGAGIYFAKHSSKSNQYAFGLNGPCPTHDDKNCDICERKMLLCRVTLGKIKKEENANRHAHPPPRYNSVEGVARPGKLKYPEYIVYRGEQVYPEYLITYKIVK